MSKQLFYIESQYYSINALNKNIDKDDIILLVKKGILESVNSAYKFNFVGVISIKNIAFTVLPKTLKVDSKVEIGLTLKTLKKYSNNNSKLFDGIDYFNIEPEHPECSELAIAEFLIKDFHDNGLYKYEEALHKINGEGNINWALTVNDIYPLYNKNQPVYVDTINQVTVDDRDNLTLAIHKWSLGYVIKKYSGFLLEDFNQISFDYLEDLDEIGNNEQLINHLQKQLYLIYSDREIRLIKSLIYLIKKKAGALENELSLFGTKKYENVWESICKLVVNDNYKAGQYFSNPIWNILEKTNLSSATLIPDITSEDIETGNFYLFDAKYYSLNYKNGLSGEPGYKDILKQFQYQHHIEDKLEKDISNAFLFPLSDNIFQELEKNPNTIFFNKYMCVIGSVKYDIKPYNNKCIWVVMCPFSIWQENYIRNKSITYSKMFWKP